MKFAVILGSVRTQREGHKAAHFVVKSVQNAGHEAVLVDCKEYALPIIDLMYKEMPNPEPKFRELHDIYDSADGFLLVTAEYNHGIPPGMKNMLDHYQSEFYFKPSGIVSYSNGSFGGVRATEQLRLVCAELGMPSTPIAFHIPHITTAFDDHGVPPDDGAYERIKRFLGEFEWYARALKDAREKGTPYR